MNTKGSAPCKAWAKPFIFTVAWHIANAKIISLLTFRYLEKPENTGFGADGVAYLNLTGGCPLLLTTTNNAFQRKDNDYE